MALTGESYGIEEKPAGLLGEMTQDRGGGGGGVMNLVK